MSDIKYAIFFSVLFVITGSFAGGTIFTITPISAGTAAAPQLITPGQTVVATYKVTNTSGSTLPGDRLDPRTLPAGNVVTQDTSSGTFADQCGATFTLANNQSCTLRLWVTGAVDQSAQTYETPGVCYGAYYACSQPTKANRLYVIAVPATPLLAISAVSVGQMGDDAGAEFSTRIQLTNGSYPLANWQIGFYMPRSFAALTSATQNINPRLSMQICTMGSSPSCMPLIYQRASGITETDESLGSSIILAPQSQFVLQPNTAYVITLAHNNQWNAGNYSALPQNYFILFDGQVSTIPTSSSTYTLLDYNPTTTASTISSHLSTNWSNSNALTSGLSIIPSPVSFIFGTGGYPLETGLIIHNMLNTDNTVANFFVTDLLADLQMNATVDNNSSATTGIVIKLITDGSTINNNPEGYQMIMTSNAITINALNNTGVFYALQTLRQLWGQSSVIPAGTLVDYPRFKYRGVLLDTARHFFTVDQIKNLIDIAAAHKLNTLHIHFADDEGFRIGLADYYNTLATAADTRGYGNSMMALMFIQANLDITNSTGATTTYPYVNTTYSGIYSETDLRTLISYANVRGITIIPEIDLPGHVRALIKAFPSQFVDLNDLSQYLSVQGYNDDVLPVCTYNTPVSVGTAFTALLDNMITQTGALFSGQTTLYAVDEISVGGDEVSSGAWSRDSSCTGEWSTLSALQKAHKFFGLLAANHPTLKISGWQQYVQNDGATLGNNIVPATQAGHVWVWNTTTGGIAQVQSLAKNAYPVVLAFADQLYFDLAYTPNVTEPGFTWAAPFLDTQSALSSALSASTVLAGLNTEEQLKILGIEGTLWSENLANNDHMIYMALPKMAGLAEAGWSPSAITATNSNTKVDWQDLAHRLGCGNTGFLAYLNKLYGVHYRGYPNGIALEVPTCNFSA